MPSINAQTALARNSGGVDRAMERLASGYRINKSSDDVAGLAISEQIRSYNRGQAQAERNARDGISFIQVAEGGLREASNIVVRIRELATQAASDTVGSKERGFLNLEVQQLKEELSRIVKTTEYTGTKLLDGSGGTLDFHVGPKGGDDYRISYEAGQADVSLEKLDIADSDVSNKDSAKEALGKVEGAITGINSVRATYGALQSRMDTAINNLRTSQTNLTAAISRIKDADFASESAELAKATILQEAGSTVLAQANVTTQQALKLL